MARTQFSVASFNLYNLQHPGLPLYFNTTPWTQPEYDRKIAFAGDMMGRMSADVWGFQELWHGDGLSDILQAAGLSGSYTALVHADRLWRGGADGYSGRHTGMDRGFPG